MKFLIVSVGWRCQAFWEQTLRSIEEQSVDNYAVRIVYDGGDDAGPEIAQWCKDHGDRWSVQLNETQQFAVRNQVEAIAHLKPKDDDVVVFLDLDGDQLAHRDVLAHLADYYADGTLVTYGSYEAIPAEPPSPPASPFPAHVVASGNYRQYMLGSGGMCHFNHLRVIRGSVVNAIPPETFHWADGRWYDAGTDYLFMVAALELAAGRYKCIDEILCRYNHENPEADYLVHAAETSACVDDFLHRAPLNGLAAVTVATHPPAIRPPVYIPPADGPNYEVVLPDGTVERYGTFIPASRRALETSGTVHDRTAAPSLQPRVQPPVPEIRDPSQPYLPHDARREVLRGYGVRHGLRVFIETGTNRGDTPAALMGDFDRLYTIEVDRKLFQAAAARFANTNVTCLHGDSATVLPDVLSSIDEPALLWLDGHVCSRSEDRGAKDTPILEELAAVFATGLPHVVLIDDARLFAGMSHHAEQPEWPDIDEVRSLAIAHGYQFDVTDDIARLIPKESL